MLLYRILRSIVGWLAPRLLRLQTQGLDNFPAEGPYIIAANHIHALDPIIVAIVAPHHVSFMAKEEFIRSPLIGWLARKVGAFPVKRGEADIGAIRQALRVLKAGNVLGIFPEGTRSKTGEMQDGHTGVALLAARADVPIVPIALYGQYRLGNKFRVNVGEPVYIESAIRGRPTPEERARETRRLMQEIARLLAECREED